MIDHLQRQDAVVDGKRIGACAARGRSEDRMSARPMALSILDLSPVAAGSSGAVSLRNSLDLARLADKIGITQANLFVLKSNRGKAIRFTTLEALCKALDCQPGDILRYKP